MGEHWDVHNCTIREEISLEKLPFRTRIKEAARKLVVANPDSLRALECYTALDVIEERDKQLKSGSWIIHPYSLFTTYFEMWMVFVLFVSLMYRFLDICIMPEVANRLLADQFFFTTDLVFMAVILRTGFPDEIAESIVMDQRAIVRKYMCSTIIFADLLVLISDIPGLRMSPFYIEVFSNLGLFRLARLPTFFTYLRRMCQYLEMSYFAYILTRNVVLIIFALQYMTCLIYFTWLLETGRVFKYGGNGTVMSMSEFVNVFIPSMWWASSYLLGIDVWFDTTTFYCLTGVTSIIIGRFIEFYIIVTLASALLGSDAEVRYYQVMSEVNKYMTSRKFPLKLQQKMRLYYSYKYMRQYLHETRMQRFLSESLRREISFYQRQMIIKHANIFQSVPEDTVVTLLSHVSHEIYLPNENVIRAGAMGESMFFIGSGTVAMYSPSGKELFHLQEGDSFGAHCVLTAGQRRFVTVIALEISELYKLNRKTFKTFFQEDVSLQKHLEHQSEIRRQLVDDIEAMYKESL